MTPQQVFEAIEPIEGWFDLANVETLAGLKLPDKPVIVECGTYKGRSTMAFYHLFPDARIYTCDPHNTPQHLPPNTYFFLGRGKDMDVSKEIDLLFIDDSHYYDDIKENFEHFVNQVKKGGYVLFHDYHFETSDVDGVRRFVNELGGCDIHSGGIYGMAIWKKQ